MLPLIKDIQAVVLSSILMLLFQPQRPLHQHNSFYCLAAPQEDLVTHVPGLTKQPPYKQYAGYLSGDSVGDKFLHYWFVESSSDPQHDPVVVWTNGGPGCSGFMGMLTELGPYKFKPDGTLEYNPYTWSQVANIIYLETPVGVGYSYSESGNIKTDDDVTAKQNAAALQDFFKKFPEYRENDFYIASESYGGIYAPTLASLVMDIPSIRLKGFIIGNAFSNTADNRNSLMYFLYYHGLVGDEQWSYMLGKCCPESEPHRCDFTKAAKKDKNCAAQVKELHSLAWNSPGLDVYNLYRQCDGGVRAASSLLWKGEDLLTSSYYGWKFGYLDAFENTTDKLLGVSCTNYTSLIDYMNSDAVRHALHVKPNLPRWSPCSSRVSAVYKGIYDDTSKFYKKALEHKLRMLLFNGDVDMACNFLGDEWFVDRLPLKNASKRKFWYYTAQDKTKQIAGLIKTFDLMSLVTVKGSGHLVPHDKPIPALELFINYIQHKPFVTT